MKEDIRSKASFITFNNNRLRETIEYFRKDMIICNLFKDADIYTLGGFLRARSFKYRTTCAGCNGIHFNRSGGPECTRLKANEEDILRLEDQFKKALLEAFLE